MIMVKLNGRLGNQIFQYAFAMAASKTLSTYYIIDDTEHVDYFAIYFKKPSFADNKIIRRSFQKFIKPPHRIIRQTGNEDNEFILHQVIDNHYYNGFFQSSVYFENVSAYITDKIIIKKRHRDLFKKRFNPQFENKKILAIHFRLKDYLDWGNDELGGINMALPDSYYYNAFEQIPNPDEYTIVIVADDIKSAETRIPDIKNKVIFSESEIIDFQLLMHADMLIISNSSFAWWSAYLNPKASQIFAPKYWLGFKVNKEFPSGIMSQKFTPVNVY
jgi:hypothetical protein